MSKFTVLRSLLIVQLCLVSFGCLWFWTTNARDSGVQHFNRSTTAASNLISSRLTAIQNELNAISALYKASRDITPDELSAFLDNGPFRTFGPNSMLIESLYWIGAADNAADPSISSDRLGRVSAILAPTGIESTLKSRSSSLSQSDPWQMFFLPAAALNLDLPSASNSRLALVKPVQRSVYSSYEGMIRGYLVAVIELNEIIDMSVLWTHRKISTEAKLQSSTTMLVGGTEHASSGNGVAHLHEHLDSNAQFVFSDGILFVRWATDTIRSEPVLTSQRIAALLALLGLTLAGWYVVSGIERLNKSLIQARDKSQAAGEAKAQFLAKMSHEIRTPINAIIGMADLLGKSNLTAGQRSHLEKLNWSAEGLISLIDEVLNFSRLQERRVSLEFRPVKLRPYFHKVLEGIRPLAEKKGLSLVLDTAGDIPEWAIIDEHRTRQICLNLLSNSCKFTSSGYVGLFVRTEADPEDPKKIWLEIVVRDSGVGIDYSAQQKIFDRFSQADNSTSRVYGGSGLGLAIVSELVALHQGTVTVASIPGHGSAFTIRLPSRRASDEEIEAIQAAMKKKARAPTVTAETMPLSIDRPLKLLVAEDDRINRYYIDELLKGLGQTVVFAHDGLEAVDRVKAEKFDAVLMDCQMPRCDGYMATRKIRALGDAYSEEYLPIIALTAHALPYERDKCIESGMNDFLTKPIREATLVAALQRWAHRSSNAPQRDSQPGAALPSGEAVSKPPAAAMENTARASDETALTATASPTAADTQPAEDGSPQAAHTPEASAHLVSAVQWNELKQMMNSKFPDIMKCFIEDLEKYAETISRAYSDADHTTARRIAHSLKSTSLLVGAEPLHVVAKDAEATFDRLGDAQDVPEADALVQNLIDMTAKVACEINRRMSEETRPSVTAETSKTESPSRSGAAA